MHIFDVMSYLHWGLGQLLVIKYMNIFTAKYVHIYTKGAKERPEIASSQVRSGFQA